MKYHHAFTGCEGNLSLKRKGLMPKKRVHLNYEQRTFRADCKYYSQSAIDLYNLEHAK